MISKIQLKDFKCYSDENNINLNKLNLLFGSNSAGKSTLVQSMMLLKQTVESRFRGISLLTSGQYMDLGVFADLVNNEGGKRSFSLGLTISNDLNIGMKEPLIKNSEKSELEDGKSNIYNAMNSVFTFKEYRREVYLETAKYYGNIEFNPYEYSIKYNKDKTTRVMREGRLEDFLSLEDQRYYDIESSDGYKDVFAVSLDNLFPDQVVVESRHEELLIIKNTIEALYDLHNPNNKKASAFGEYENTMEVLEYIQETSKEVMSESENILNSYAEEHGLSGLTMNNEEKALANTIDKFVAEHVVLNNLQLFDRALISIVFAAMVIRLNGKNDEYIRIIKGLKNQLEQLRIGFSVESVESIEQDTILLYGDRTDNLSNSIGEGMIDKVAEKTREALKDISYLGPLRSAPRYSYNKNMDINPKYVGKDGEYLASVMVNFFNRRFFVPLPKENPFIIERNNFTLRKALNSWCKYLQVADSVYVSNETANAFTIKVKSLNCKEATNLVNVGVGISQVLPVLVMGLVSEAGDTLIFEQPELHLHPFIQSRLADFFIELSKMGRQIIVETHSEPMLHRMKYKIIKQRLHPDDLTVHFFENSPSGMKYYEESIGEYGEIEYPTNFRDETEVLYEEILNATLERVRHEAQK